MRQRIVSSIGLVGPNTRFNWQCWSQPVLGGLISLLFVWSQDGLLEYCTVLSSTVAGCFSWSFFLCLSCLLRFSPSEIPLILGNWREVEIYFPQLIPAAIGHVDPVYHGEGNPWLFSGKTRAGDSKVGNGLEIF